MNIIQSTGAKTLAFIQALGANALFLLQILLLLPQTLLRARLTIRQMYFSGVLSVLIIAVSGLFVGMVIGLQGYTQLAKFKSADVLGFMVAASLLRELGPVLAAILFASSAGGAMTSEIGLMKTTEQLEAMDVMAVNPVARVVAPRFWAGVVSMPLLACIFNVAGIYGGYLVGVQWLGLDTGGGADCRVSRLSLHAHSGRHSARQHAHGGVVCADCVGVRFYFDRVYVYLRQPENEQYPPTARCWRFGFGARFAASPCSVL